MDKLKIRDNIEKLIKLLIKKADEEHIKGKDTHLTEYEAVKNYLESLSKEEFFQIFTIMDYGRHSEFNEEIPLEKAIKKFENWDKNQTIFDMLEKKPKVVIEYLNEGMTHFSI